MGRKGWIGWGSAFAVSGALWLVAQTWEDPGPPPEKRERAYVCVASGGGEPACPGSAGLTYEGTDPSEPVRPVESTCAASEAACVEVWPQDPRTSPR